LVKPEEEKEYRIIGGDDLANMGKIRLSDEELRNMSSVKVFGDSYPVPYNPLKYLKEEYSPHLKPYYAVIWADHREVDPMCKEKRHIKDVRNIDSIQAYLEALFPGNKIKPGVFTDGKTGKKFIYQSSGARKYLKK